MTDIIYKVMLTKGIRSYTVFKRAYDYWEIRISKNKLLNCHAKFCTEGVLPDVVEDYCIDILANRESLDE